MIGLIFMLILLFMCVFAPLFTSYDAETVDFTAMRAAPSREHIFGTDRLGRDIFARILYGGRVSILVGVAELFPAL